MHDVYGTPVTTRYFYNGSFLIEEQDASGTTIATYVDGVGSRPVLSMNRGGAAYFLHRNHNHSTTVLTNAAGSVVERYDYGDFGYPVVTDGEGQLVPPGSEVGNPYRFRGMRQDPETGFYVQELTGRYYDAVTGRFIARGPANTLGNACTAFANDPWSSAACTIYIHPACIPIEWDQSNACTAFGSNPFRGRVLQYEDHYDEVCPFMGGWRFDAGGGDFTGFRRDSAGDWIQPDPAGGSFFDVFTELSLAGGRASFIFSDSFYEWNEAVWYDSTQARPSIGVNQFYDMGWEVDLTGGTGGGTSDLQGIDFPAQQATGGTVGLLKKSCMCSVVALQCVEQGGAAYWDDRNVGRKTSSSPVPYAT